MRSILQKYTNSTTFYGLVDFTSGLNNQLDLENFRRLVYVPLDRVRPIIKDNT